MTNEVASKKFSRKGLQIWGNGEKGIWNKMRVCFHKMTDNRACLLMRINQ